MRLNLVEMTRQLALQQIQRCTAQLHALNCHTHCDATCEQQGRWWCVLCGVDRTTKPHEPWCDLGSVGPIQ